MIEKKAVNNLRVLACEMIQNANSGHPGIALGSAPILYTLFSKSMRVDIKNPSNFLRDRFVLSAGHGSSILYATLYAMGYNYSIDDLKNFRKLNSKTPGHPEVNIDFGVECTTGPLGQGVATAVGLALAEKILSEKFNKKDCKLFDNHTYALVGEGCLMEGVSFEALSFAGNLNLNKLIVLYDCNKISLDGETKETFNIDINKVFEGLGFNVFEVKDGNDINEIDDAIKRARKSLKPSFIKINTIIGFGSDFANSHKSHGAPLGEQGIESLRKNLNVNSASFKFEKEVEDHFKECKKRLEVIGSDLNDKLKFYKKNYKKEYARIFDFFKKTDFENLKSILEKITVDKNLASRDLGAIVLNEIANNCPQVIGGTADLSSSTKAFIKEGGKISKFDYDARNIMFGVREFGMSCICNGLALYGFRPFASTFLVFSDYLKNGIRLSALMNLPLTYIFTHDSIAVGEDGPTHQPIEQLIAIRAIPNVKLFRPANLSETCASYLNSYITNSPTVIALSRQNLYNFNSEIADALKGGYVVDYEGKNNELNAVIVATGSEVKLALDVKAKLKMKGFGVRVVSMPCVELFLEQPESYQNKILPKNFPSIISIEAGSTMGWSRITGKNGVNIGIDEFGTSAPFVEVFKKFEMTEDKICQKVIKMIKKNKTKINFLFS